MRRVLGWWNGLAARLGAGGRELAALAGVIGAAAVLRFVDLAARGGWDSDQGTEMLALRNALASGQLPTFGPEAISVTTPFHHGALYYDLLLPAAWLGNGNPTWVVGEIALLSLLVVPVCWWIARSIGGPAAGLIAALLAAISAGLIGYATFIWNPTLVEPGAAVAYLGAWQAVRGRSPRWWLLSAAGAALAVQAHVAAAVIVAPLGLAFALDLWRSAGRRRSVALWGAAGIGLVVLTYLPLIASELTHDFADTRSMLAYFTDPGTTAARDPVTRVVISAIRILAWPLTRWPLVDLGPALGVAFLVASGLIMGLVWRVGAAAKDVTGARAHDAAPAGTTASPGEAPLRTEIYVPLTSSTSPTPVTERLGTSLVGIWLLLIVLALGLGLAAVSEVQGLPTEQYHVVADPLVFVAAGLIIAGLWRAISSVRVTTARRATAIALMVFLVAWNAAHWPPLQSPDGGWPAAQAAASRLESDAGGSTMALVPLFAAKGSDAYVYPLTRDGVALGTADRATIVVLLCDTYWLTGCGGKAEDAWLSSDPSASGLVLVERFAAAPDRLLSVYRRR